VLFQDALISYY